MYSHTCRLTAIVVLLTLCSCRVRPSLPSDKNTQSSTGSSIQAYVIPQSTATTPVDITEEGTRITPSSVSVSNTLTGLHCTNYVEAQWGTDLEEFGLCPSPSEAWIRGPYPPRLDEHGNLFIVDKANQRILRYSEGTALQAISIPSAYVLDDVCSYSNRAWPNVTVSKDRLFFMFSTRQGERVVDHLAVLSTNGQEQQIIDLELYYPLHSPYLNSLISDRQGGVYLLLPPAGVVHFDAELRPEFKYMGSDDLLIYESIVVGWDGNLYTYSAESDSLVNWGTDNRLFMLGEWLSRVEGVIAATSIVSPTYSRLLGADAQGRLYFKTRGQGDEAWLARISSQDERVIAAVPEGEPLPESVAPDGSLYGITYDSADPSVKPRIVRCVFDQK